MSVRIIESSGTLGTRITPEQREAFDRQGCLHFKQFLDPASIAEAIQAMEEIEERWLRDGVKVVNGTPIKYGTNTDGSPMVQRFAFASQHHPVLDRILRDPRLAAILELLGPDARLGTHEKDGLVVNHYVNSDGSKFAQMGWHTDSIRDVFLGKKVGRMLNLGIHLDDQDPMNGGLRILPGTHRQGMWGMLFHKAYFLDRRADPSEVAFRIKAGDLTVHDGSIWHRVQRSSLIGEASRRRVMYIPVISGVYEPKTEASPTPFYHRFLHLVK